MESDSETDDLEQILERHGSDMLGNLGEKS
jgi:hypothetical protein